jgi:hypothetical protein
MSAPLSAAVSGDTLARQLAAVERLVEFRGLEVFSLRADECPHVMDEIGRLREKVFRASGAGRGEPIDVDPLDFGPLAYRQLVAFDPQAKQLVAMLRYQRGALTKDHGIGILRTSSLFDYSESFQRDVLPRGLELGRSVVSSEARRGSVGLFALWRGLAALTQGDTPLDYFFGNVTIYDSYPKAARDALVATVEHLYGPDAPQLIAKPNLRLIPDTDPVEAKEALRTARDGVQHVQGLLAGHSERMPSILQSYLSLSLGVQCGQTARDSDFGEAYEMGVIVPLRKIEPRARKLFGLRGL